jgi:hypothetical protein
MYNEKKIMNKKSGILVGSIRGELAKKWICDVILKNGNCFGPKRPIALHGYLVVVVVSFVFFEPAKLYFTRAKPD